MKQNIHFFLTSNCFQQYSYICWKIPSRILLSSSYSPNKNYLSWTLGTFLHALVAKKSADCDDSQFCPREFSWSRFWHHFGLGAGGALTLTRFWSFKSRPYIFVFLPISWLQWQSILSAWIQPITFFGITLV